MGNGYDGGKYVLGRKRRCWNVIKCSVWNYISNCIVSHAESYFLSSSSRGILVGGRKTGKVGKGLLVEENGHWYVHISIYIYSINVYWKTISTYTTVFVEHRSGTMCGAWDETVVLSHQHFYLTVERNRLIRKLLINY